MSSILDDKDPYERGVLNGYLGVIEAIMKELSQLERSYVVDYVIEHWGRD